MGGSASNHCVLVSNGYLQTKTCRNHCFALKWPHMQGNCFKEYCIRKNFSREVWIQWRSKFRRNVLYISWWSVHFQLDGAPCHKARVIMKWLEDHYIEISHSWWGKSPNLNPIENLWSILKKWIDKQKLTYCDQLWAQIRQEWIAISQDLAKKLISSMTKWIVEVMKNKG